MGIFYVVVYVVIFGFASLVWIALFGLFYGLCCGFVVSFVYVLFLWRECLVAWLMVVVC